MHSFFITLVKYDRIIVLTIVQKPHIWKLNEITPFVTHYLPRLRKQFFDFVEFCFVVKCH